MVGAGETLPSPFVDAPRPRIQEAIGGPQWLVTPLRVLGLQGLQPPVGWPNGGVPIISQVTPRRALQTTDGRASEIDDLESPRVSFERLDERALEPVPRSSARDTKLAPGRA